MNKARIVYCYPKKGQNNDAQNFVEQGRFPLEKIKGKKNMNIFAVNSPFTDDPRKKKDTWVRRGLEFYLSGARPEQRFG